MTVRTVTGLDLSLTSTGLVALSADPADLGRAADALLRANVLLRASILAPRKESESTDRLEQLRDLLTELRVHMAYWPGVALWILEGYAYGQPRGTSRLADLAELGGVVKWWLHVERQRVLVVPPARLKKFVCLRGNAKKDEMRLAVYKRWGFEHASHDVVDAYALARLGLAALGLDEGLTVEQRKVAEELAKQLEGSERT